MDAELEVIAASKARMTALAQGDVERLTPFLHQGFRWTDHEGESYDRDGYIREYTQKHTVWRSQEIGDPEVVIVGDTAVLHAEVTDVAIRGEGLQVFRTPVTQVWVREEGSWTCLAGHAGPIRS